MLVSLNRQQPAFVPAKAKEIEMKTLCYYAVFMILVINVSFAPIAKGQQQQTTQTVVNPSVLPNRLPIGSEQVMRDWIVTSQWANKSLQLSEFTVFSVYYKDTEGVENRRYYPLTNLGFGSFQNFEDKLVEYGMKIFNDLLTNSHIDIKEPLSVSAFHAYMDDGKGLGVGGIYMEKNLGFSDEITPESFRDLQTVAKQSIVRIPNLEKFEIYVEVGDTNYSYSWPSKSVRPASGFPVEVTTADYIALASWYGEGQYKARFKITAGGQIAVYTQHGTKIEAPELQITGSGVNIGFPLGSDTTIQESSDLMHWKTVRTVPWDFGTNSVSINYGNSGSSKKFFRAKSE